MSCQEDMKFAKEVIAKTLEEFKAVEHALTHVLVEPNEIPEVVDYLKSVGNQIMHNERVLYFLNRNNVLIEKLNSEPIEGT